MQSGVFYTLANCACLQDLIFLHALDMRMRANECLLVLHLQLLLMKPRRTSPSGIQEQSSPMTIAEKIFIFYLKCCRFLAIRNIY